MSSPRNDPAILKPAEADRQMTVCFRLEHYTTLPECFRRHGGKIMKKKAAVLAAVLVCSLCACGSQAATESAEQSNDYSSTVENSAIITESVEDMSQVMYGDETESETAQAEPDVPPALVVPTDTSQQQSTIFNESLTAMLKPMDAVMVAAQVTGIDCDPENDISVWTTMYYYMALYGPLVPGAGYTENNEYLYVGEDVIREAGRVLYGEEYSLPPIPEQIQRISVHDDGKYYIKMDPRPDGYPIFCSAVKNGDGTYEAVAQLITDHGNIISTQSFHFEPKMDTNALLGESYAYTIGNLGVG